MKSRYTLALIFFLLLNVSFKLDFSTPLKIYSFSGSAQGTSYSIKYKYHKEAIKQREIDSLFTVFDLSLSRYNQVSLLYKLNKAKSKANLDSHLLKVLHYAHEMNQATNGCFEYRLLPLLELWGFGNKKQSSFPDSIQVDKILYLIKSNNLIINKLTVIKSSKSLAIDLDGIAQGYCVDQLSDFMSERGIIDYIVEIGGEVFVSGNDLDNRSWKIGLGDNQYLDDNKNKLVLAGMNRVGISSSGSLQKFKKFGDQYFSHIIDPRTGYPVQNGIVSVTVIAPSTMQADALDNAFMVMGIKDSFEWCEKYSSIGVYFSYVNPIGQVVDTANGYFKQFIQPIN